MGRGPILNSLIEKGHGQDTLRFTSRNIIAMAMEPEPECEETGGERVMGRPGHCDGREG